MPQNSGVPMRYLFTGASGFIGTNYVSYLMRNGVNEILNADIAAARDSTQSQFHITCDIMAQHQLQDAFEKCKPDIVIHFAARTDMDGKTIDDYAVNSIGTQNVLHAVKNSSSVKHVIITSTQYVHQYKGEPKHDEDFAPHTLYGESKVLAEKYTRQADLTCPWTIIRPTNIWGPWHSRYPHEFWKIVSEGKYFHPKGKPVIRSYGYVENVIWQIEKILASEQSKVDKQVFYVGDEPLELYDWANGFCLAQTGKPARLVSYSLLKLIAYFGDMVKYFGGSFPLFSSRLVSMTTGNEADMSKTFKVFGASPNSLDDGIQKTVAWMKEHAPDLVKKI